MAQTHSLSSSIRLNEETYTSSDEYPLIEQAWHALTEWEQWRNWLPEIVQLSHIDEGESGRGTRFRIYTPSSVQMWTISHWQPGHRLGFIVDGASQQSALGITFAENEADGSLDILLEAEYEFSGMRRLLAPVLLRWRARYLQNFLRALSLQISSNFTSSK
ncbi:MAG: SRPBCC family protein [Gammaproteobacteria bacterium]|jgi:hypothetical protein|nr:SRPBCC family protein [Gammaproteobacteria bacterium]MBT3860410.1 SRPBCC family protein [Gammaproteobacteria bacterium]MBT3988709.1 SRPBCC family protein [Gammaproteobacteria bacterium]MBT4255126.1 SRPBCC family protein [Gammaproteobacteria bacterium]MBT4581431.1 SRPBCC family protein [Gammaproteobacteria bacterium]